MGNGCDVNEYKEQLDYPHCEEVNLTTIENEFSSSVIPFQENNPDYNWAKPGDCMYFRDKVTSGKGFNGRPVSGCDLTGKTIGVKGRDSLTQKKENHKKTL